MCHSGTALFNFNTLICTILIQTPVVFQMWLVLMLFVFGGAGGWARNDFPSVSPGPLKLFQRMLTDYFFFNIGLITDPKCT